MEMWQDPKTIILWFVIVLVLVVTLLTFIFFLIKSNYQKIIQRNELLYQERLKNEKDIKQAMITAQDTERKLIASEIHDQISNKLNLLILKISSLPANSQQTEFDFIKNELKSLVQRNRDISHFLFPIEIENLGLIFTLQDLATKYQSKEFHIKLYFEDGIFFQNKQVEHQLYRVVQESINNAIKHGKATEMNIHIKRINNQLCLMITDNGKGFDPEKITKGIGITNIETRLNSINATFKLKSQINKGTRLLILV